MPSNRRLAQHALGANTWRDLGLLCACVDKTYRGPAESNIAECANRWFLPPPPFFSLSTTPYMETHRASVLGYRDHPGQRIKIPQSGSQNRFTVFDLTAYNFSQGTAWCSEIGSLASLDACNSGAFGDVREPISLHQAVTNSGEVESLMKILTSVIAIA